MEKVALVRFQDSIRESVRMGLEHIGGLEKTDAPILIKPNICTISDGTGHSVTDIRLVEAVVDLFFETFPDASIRIIESDSQSKNAMESFEKFGYTSLKDEKRKQGFDVDIVDLSNEPLVPVAVNGMYFDTIKLHEILTEPHYYISLAIAKTHETAFLTASFKNQFGLLPNKGKASYHAKIDEILVDLNRIVPSDLCIVDARVGVEGWNGPKTRPIGAFIVGKNPVSVDTIVTKVMGLDVTRVRHLMLANENNMGSLSPRVSGERIEAVQVEFDAPF